MLKESAGFVKDRMTTFNTENLKLYVNISSKAYQTVRPSHEWFGSGWAVGILMDGCSGGTWMIKVKGNWRAKEKVGGQNNFRP